MRFPAFVGYFVLLAACIYSNIVAAIHLDKKEHFRDIYLTIR
jgi:hypothetical protein